MIYIKILKAVISVVGIASWIAQRILKVSLLSFFFKDNLLLLCLFIYLAVIGYSCGMWEPHCIMQIFHWTHRLSLAVAVWTIYLWSAGLVTLMHVGS